MAQGIRKPTNKGKHPPNFRLWCVTSVKLVSAEGIYTFLLPIITIFSMWVLNKLNNGYFVAAVLIFLIPLYILSIFCRNRSFALPILSISFSALCIQWLVSTGIVGNDIHTEYEAYRQFLNGTWINDIPLISRSLGVSVLPGIIETALHTAGTRFDAMVYKGIFVCINSFTPLVVYFIAKRVLSRRYAFVASLLLIIQIGFLDTATDARFSLALFVFSLSLLFFVKKQSIPFGVTLALLPFCHYSVTYVALLLYSGVLLTKYLWQWFRSRVKPQYGMVIALAVGLAVSSWWLYDVNITVLRMNVIAFEDVGRAIERKETTKIEVAEPKSVTITQSRVGSSPSLRTKNTAIEQLFFKGFNFPFMLNWIPIILGVMGLVNMKNITYWLLGLFGLLLLVLMITVPHWSVWYSPFRMLTQATVILCVAVIAGHRNIARMYKVSPEFIFFPWWMFMFIHYTLEGLVQARGLI